MFIHIFMTFSCTWAVRAGTLQRWMGAKRLIRAHETKYENPSTLIVSGERNATSKYVFCGAQPNGLCIVHAKSPSCVRPTHIYIFQSSFYLFIFSSTKWTSHTHTHAKHFERGKWMRSSRSQRVARSVKRNTNTRRRPILIHSINWLK